MNSNNTKTVILVTSSYTIKFDYSRYYFLDVPNVPSAFFYVYCASKGHCLVSYTRRVSWTMLYTTLCMIINCVFFCFAPLLIACACMLLLRKV